VREVAIAMTREDRCGDRVERLERKSRLRRRGGTTGSGLAAEHFAEGSIYTWADGTKARLHNGAWVSVKTKNLVCVPNENQ
jgi:hypothetical protein